MKRKVKIFAGISLSIIVLVCAAVMLLSNDKNSNMSDYNSLKSFGNQQDNFWNTYAYDGNNLYTVTWRHEIGSEDMEKIIKLQIGSPAVLESLYSVSSSIKTVYSLPSSSDMSLRQVSVFDGWVYFAECEIDSDESTEMYYLYRIREDGSDREKLGKFSGPKGDMLYVLTEEKIVYEDEKGISTMNLDGTEKEAIIPDETEDDTDIYLAGVDNGWIYYESHYYTIFEQNDLLYRTRFDGSDMQKVLDLAEKRLYVVDGEKIFFSTYSEYKPEEYLKKQTIGGEEKVLFEASDGVYLFNKEGNWVYFGAGNKVYRINTDGKSEEETVYCFRGEDSFASSISVYDGDLLITYNGGQVMYIKQDGTVTDLTDYVGRQ